jgi:hypothetical protein
MGKMGEMGRRGDGEMKRWGDKVNCCSMINDKCSMHWHFFD